MRLSKVVAEATRAFIIKNHGADKVKKFAIQCRAYGDAATVRFVFQIWYSIPNFERNQLLAKDPAVVFVGGYTKNVTDQNLETMLKAAFKDEIKICSRPVEI